MEISFNDRTSYLSWRANWRAEYKKLSLTIREKKQELKAAMRSQGDAYKLQRQIPILKGMATSMLEQRAEAKEQAGIQRAAAMAAKTEATA